ncbi:DUF6882 domain-containing protein [Marinactinospora thermotolerans]|uniref:Uncharacterized protein n=1 Tax=Marinactinospora thermotolerans DSM 45154 TaxID=1122192 RepID=A0A1T4RB70_9ACTN|nr:DUF6882 domain-containing protein [Marinactinospora thermotolerans]SKA13169.1 hypothetical protein SAMN02745673_02667 [Marinactinospora thermotolerans DSM 45154]
MTDGQPTTGRQWFGPRLEALGAAHAAVALEQLPHFNDHLPDGDWQVDVEASVFTQGGVDVHMAPLGTFGTDGSWLWAWANPHMHPPGSARLAASLALREIGERDDIPELVTPRLELAEFTDPRMAAERLCLTAMGVLGGRGYAGVTADTGARFYMLVNDPAVPVAGFDPVTLPRMLTQAIGVFPHDHRATAANYLGRHGFAGGFSTEGDVLVGERPDCAVRVEFDAHDRISGISIQPRTASAPA